MAGFTSSFICGIFVKKLHDGTRVFWLITAIEDEAQWTPADSRHRHLKLDVTCPIKVMAQYRAYK